MEQFFNNAYWKFKKCNAVNMPFAGKRLCFNLLQQKAALALAVNTCCKPMADSLVGSNKGGLQD